MDSSPLSKLPQELRDEIYGLSLQLPDDVLINNIGGRLQVSKELKGQKILALTATCKQLRCESLKIFFSMNTFDYQTNVLTRNLNDFTRHFIFCEWITLVELSCPSALKHVNIDLGWEFVCISDILSKDASKQLGKLLKLYKESKMRCKYSMTVRVNNEDINFEDLDLSNASKVIEQNLAEIAQKLERTGLRVRHMYTRDGNGLQEGRTIT